MQFHCPNQYPYPKIYFKNQVTEISSNYYQSVGLEFILR